MPERLSPDTIRLRQPGWAATGQSGLARRAGIAVQHGILVDEMAPRLQDGV